MIQEVLEKEIDIYLKGQGIENPEYSFEFPGELAFGDLSTNVAMVYGKTLGKNPKVLAEELQKLLSEINSPYIEKVTIAGPGFINFSFSKKYFEEITKKILENKDEWGGNTIFSGKKVMVEYTQPNPFKPFHIGHLMSNAIGESLSRIVEFSAAHIVRANYQGDVGLHVAKAIWGLVQRGKPDATLSVSAQAQYIGECYSYAANLYETDEVVKKDIDQLNKKVYDRSDEAINALYDWGRAITLEAFEEIYTLLGTKFDHYFFESQMAPIGEKLVHEYLEKGIFEKSDNAIVFHGEEYNPKLHTRVFISSLGLPMYETKEIGLTFTKFEEENPDLSITTTAIEQGEYMKVVTEAIKQMKPEYAERMMHITHGMMRLASGKMASRKGNVITGESLINDSRDVVFEKITDRDFDDEAKKIIADVVGVGALKYSILRSSLGSDIIYDFEKSISFEGDSGPYLQYSATRAHSVLEKAKSIGMVATTLRPEHFEKTVLEQLLCRFPAVVERACREYAPHFIVTYLTELAGAFNAFYADNHIANKEDIQAPYLLALTESFYITMENGLWTLGITLPPRM